MSTNKSIYDTSIDKRVLNSRSVSIDKANGANSLFQANPDGTLYAQIIKDYRVVKFKRSTDNGFTWDDMERSCNFGTLPSEVTGGRPTAYYYGENNELYFFYGTESAIYFSLNGSDADYLNDKVMYKFISWPDNQFDGNINDSFFSSSGDGDGLVYICYMNSLNELRMLGFEPKRCVSYAENTGYPLFGHCFQDIATCSGFTPVSKSMSIKSYEDKVHVAVVQSPNWLCYIPYTKKIGSGVGSWGHSTLIDRGIISSSGNFSDIAIDIDGDGRIGIKYTYINGSNVDNKFAFSEDNGTTWTKLSLSAPSGYSNAIDEINSGVIFKGDILGGFEGKFLLSSIYEKDGNKDLFVKTIDAGEIEPLPPNHDPYSTYIAVGPSGYIANYDDPNWNQITAITSNSINAITKGVFPIVAVGNSGTILKSSDGNSWSSATSPTTYNLNDVSYRSGVYCAVGDSGVILTSTDTTTWAAPSGTIPNTRNLVAVKPLYHTYQWGILANRPDANIGYLYVTNNDCASWTSKTLIYNAPWSDYAVNPADSNVMVVGISGLIFTSPDPYSTFTQRTSGVTDYLRSACYSGGKYIIAGDGGTLLTSTNGTSFTEQNPPAGGKDLLCVTPVNSGVILGGKGYCATSSSGVYPYTTLYNGVLQFNDLETTTVSGIYNSYDDQTESWKKVNSVEGNILGAKFFKYMAETIPNFGDYSDIRIAYQLGSTNNNDGEDTVSSTIFQERLTNNAYPITYSGVSPLDSNIDFYNTSGYVNEKTNLYMNKFDKVGMDYTFSRFDPIAECKINGRAGYNLTDTYVSQAVIDPGSSSFASVPNNNADFQDYIERDTRKLFFKPNLYLSRNFVLNLGGYLKRTIWTVRILGNDYEIAQIIPRFLDGYIMFYEANLYVIGPSNNPFNKAILPSET